MYEEKLMKKIALLLLFSVVACSTTDNNLVGKMLTKNIPSTEFTILEGTPLSSLRATGLNSRVGDFNLIERLYDTVWYQTEKDYDDGKLEVETEFVIFDNKSWIVEREMENGRMEEVEADDYAKLTWITDVALTDETVVDGKTASRNAAIAKNESIDELELEFEGYWLKDEHNLYIVEGDTLLEAQILLDAVIKNPTLAEYLDTEKYILSTNLQI